MHLLEVRGSKDFRLIPCKNPYQHGTRQCNRTQDNHLPVASLKTCRQMYHEIRNALSSGNHLEISHPRAACSFLRHLTHSALRLRRIELNIFIDDRKEEHSWNKAFHALSEQLKDLRHLCVKVDEQLWPVYAAYKGRHSPAFGKTPFLAGLLQFKKVPLKTFELVVGDGREGYPFETAYLSSNYIWTTDQRRLWAQSMKSAILGTD